jgi:anti-anti-sigma regulatory factor
MQYKITPQPDPATSCVTLLLNGRFSEDALPELEQSIMAAKDSYRRIYIDLSEVTLVDRKAVQYISDQASEEIKLVNCPIYLRRWITQVSDEK